MKPVKSPTPRKLALSKTTLRVLGEVEIRQVCGGITYQNCSITPNVCPRELATDGC